MSGPYYKPMPVQQKLFISTRATYATIHRSRLCTTLLLFQETKDLIFPECVFMFVDCNEDSKQNSILAVLAKQSPAFPFCKFIISLDKPADLDQPNCAREHCIHKCLPLDHGYVYVSQRHYFPVKTTR